MQLPLINAVVAFGLISTGLGADNPAAPGESPSSDIIDGLKPISAQACYYEKAVGCSKGGFCFRQCGEPEGNGNWCWTVTSSNGWKKCKKDGDCSINDRCSSGDCKDCGCSC
ncbi:hypothetical protein V2G26_006803 [Clonostachys chloroleuca]